MLTVTQYRDRQFYSGDASGISKSNTTRLYLTAEGTYDATDKDVRTPAHTYTATNGQPFALCTKHDIHNLLNGHPEKNIFVAYNHGIVWILHQYQSQLMFTPTDVHNRIFVENHGNEPVYFHIVGEIIGQSYTR